MENFWVTVRKEIGEHLPADEVEHYAFTAGLNLSFLELTRYLRKRARAASWKLRWWVSFRVAVTRSES